MWIQRAQASARAPRPQGRLAVAALVAGLTGAVVLSGCDSTGTSSRSKKSGDCIRTQDANGELTSTCLRWHPHNDAAPGAVQRGCRLPGDRPEHDGGRETGHGVRGQLARSRA